MNWFIRALAISIVTEPPSSMLRAAPKNRRAGTERPSRYHRHDLAGRGHRQVVGRASRVSESRIIATSCLLGEALGALQHELGDLDVLVGRLIEGRYTTSARDRAPPVRDLFGTLVDQRRDEVHPNSRPRCRWRPAQDRRLARLRGRDHHAALALVDRRDHVDDRSVTARGAFSRRNRSSQQQRQLVEGGGRRLASSR
jgi:hypothetical protein